MQIGFEGALEIHLAQSSWLGFPIISSDNNLINTDHSPAAKP